MRDLDNTVDIRCIGLACILNADPNEISPALSVVFKTLPSIYLSFLLLIAYKRVLTDMMTDLLTRYSMRFGSCTFQSFKIYEVYLFSGLVLDMDLSKVLPDQNLEVEDKVALHASNLVGVTLGLSSLTCL